jgi:hypothetical protein
MSVEWTITAPGGSGAVSLAEAGILDITVSRRIMAVSTATATIARDYDSEEGWWAEDSLATIYRSEDGGTPVPFFRGRVIEAPATANPETELRTLRLADAWGDLEEIIYQEAWAIGGGTTLLPKALLGKNPAGAEISTGAQIRAAVAYAITQGADLQLGTVDDGVTVWPSEITNTSCADVILGELRWNPSFAAWIDHSTSPPTFHARAASGLATETINIAGEGVASFQTAKLVRAIPRGVRIVYEDAANLDGDVYRSTYLDTAGETTGRRIMHAIIELAGMSQQRQKSRVRVREIPGEGGGNLAAQKAFLAANFPELAALPDGDWTLENFATALAPDPLPHPQAISPKAPRLAPANKTDVPNQLVTGTIEDWMRKYSGRVAVSYDLLPSPAAPAVSRKWLENFAGRAKSFTITATNATTRLYKSTNSFTEGEGRPEGIAAAVFAAASAEKHEGSITLAGGDVPATAWPGKKVILADGETVITPATVIHSATLEIPAGVTVLEFGPLPYLSAGDLMELQRMARGRPVTWMSQEERASNQLGAEGSPSAKGDTVSGYETPQLISPPGGGETLQRQWKATRASATAIDCTGGTLTSQAGFAVITVDDVTALSATASGHVILTINRNSSTRAVEGTTAITYASGALPASTYSAQIIPLAKVTVADDEITEILPLKFEELHIFEDLCVVNGEFQLADLLIASRNIYDPPPP